MKMLRSFFAVRLARTCVALAAFTMVGCAERPTLTPDVVDSGTADASDASMCLPTQLFCGGACVDAQNSATHCGRCDNACPMGQQCMSGMCQIQCPVGRTACGGMCVDTSQSSAHCGRCGNACASGELCRANMCLANSCMPPRSVCNDTCIDISIDSMNCGMCGRACMMGEICSGGMCTTSFVETGRACGSDAACGMRGRCLAAGSGYRNGYCVYPCGATGMDCDMVGVCITMGATSQCMRRCIDDGDCRSGYSCQNVGVRICLPRCTSNPALLCGENLCDTFSERCITRTCTSMTECSMGSTCAPGTMSCRCTAATDCGANRTCIATTGRCGCMNDLVCGSGHTCNTTTGVCN